MESTKSIGELIGFSNFQRLNNSSVWHAGMPSLDQVLLQNARVSSHRGAMGLRIQKDFWSPVGFLDLGQLGYGC